jgi:hypothetical protein
MTNYIEPLVTARKPTPEEWVAHHERLHNKHLQRQQQVDLAADYVTNEEIRGNEMTYPYIFIDTGTESETLLALFHQGKR